MVKRDSPHLWHVAYISAWNLMTSGSWPLPQYLDVPHGQVELTKDAPEQGGLATPTRAQQTIAAT